MRAVKRAATHSSHAVRHSQLARRQFSLSATHRADNGNGNGNGTVLNPRWFTDLRSRIKACLAADPQGEDGETLKRHLAYVDSNWLHLSAGREGFLTAERWRGLNNFAVAWGDMDSMGKSELCTIYVRVLTPAGHVNNIMYNRYAESGRVNWVTSFAANAPPEERQQWLDIMSPRSIGLILKSIRTDYKLPVTYPDRITVIHKLAQRPTYASDSIFLDAVIYSETHRRVAARCFEDIAVYDYRAGKRATLRGFMVDELQGVYDLQEESRREVDRKVEELEREVRAIEEA